jgi:uncharacterized RDD family membrane protein YckC
MSGAPPPPPPAPVSRVGFLPRLLAEIIDIVAMWALIGAVGGAVWLVATTLGAGDAAGGLLGVLAGMVVGIGYWVVLHAHGRQTLGKRAIGATVTDTELRPIGHARALGRLTAEIVSAIPFNLGYLWALWDEERQTSHDKLAGTLVVRKAELPG